MATAALILTDGLGEFGHRRPELGDTRLVGLTLTERAALAVHRAGSTGATSLLLASGQFPVPVRPADP